MNSFCYIDSPIGRLLLTCDGSALTGLYMEPEQTRTTAGWVKDASAAPLAAAARQLAEYFAGSRREFDLALRPEGTVFQTRVWGELTKIPYGRTWSYGDLAKRIGKPGAPRAVGLANGRNPLSIVVPCHRVIGADGSLTGYGGGLPRKRWLLAHEATHSSEGLDFQISGRVTVNTAPPPSERLAAIAVPP
ncbi:MAG TPA: methylated-DNA--[protein]-cysteine S-methyltransferase [Steroidobacteraceae bacterium]|nr:methylated-DNA--[protein]-cysteine S-methyltransferase [Steroidobacteraceae bacterium]